MRTFFIGLTTLFVGLFLGWYLHDHSVGQGVGNGQAFNNTQVFSELDRKESSKSTTKERFLNIDQLLNDRNIEALTVEYSRLLDSTDARVTKAAYLLVLKEVQRAIDGHEEGYANSLLSLLLDENHRDINALRLKATLRTEAEQFMLALESLYEAKGYAINADDIAEISRRVRSIADKYEGQLQQANNKYQLLALYDYLTRMEPDYSPYFIKLATMQLLNDDKASARRSLALISQDHIVGTQARSMLNELQPEQIIFDEVVNTVGDIPLQRQGHHFVVNAVANESHDVNLLIDTGATLTILTPEIFSNLRIATIDTGRKVNFNTANGTVQASVYTIKSLRIGGWEVRDIEIGVLDISGDHSIDGLLGMNYLQNFQFYIDQKSAVLRLSK